MGGACGDAAHALAQSRKDQARIAHCRAFERLLPYCAWLPAVSAQANIDIRCRCRRGALSLPP